MRKSRPGSTSKIALVVVLLASASGAAFADGRLVAYRGWQRGLVPAPLADDDHVEDVRLPNGATVRYRVARNGRTYFMGEMIPGRLSLGVSDLPQEKIYHDLVGRGRFEAAAELLDKLLADPANGQRLVRPVRPPDAAAWTSVAEVARARLQGLALPGREAFRKLRDEESRGRFMAAESGGDAPELLRLLQRYPAVAHAAHAALAAGDLAFEDGDVVTAEQAWELALQEYTDEVPVEQVEQKLARARLLRRAGGAFSPARVPAALAALSDFSAYEPEPFRLIWRRKVAAPARAHGSPLPGLLARGSGDLVFVHDDQGVLALELETGRLAWATPLERTAPWPGDDAPATVAVGETIAVIRGRRWLVILDRTTGHVRARVDLTRDLGGAQGDHLDAVESSKGRTYLAAAIGPERVLFAIDASGTIVWRTALWAPGGLDCTIAASSAGAVIAADGGVASVGPSGVVRWLRDAEPASGGLSPERGLEVRGDRAICLDLRGTLALELGTGLRASWPAVAFPAADDRAPPWLVLATLEDGPVILDRRPTTPGDSRPVILVPRGNGVLLPLRRLEFDDRPPWPGTTTQGVLYLTGEKADPLARTPGSDLVGIDLATGREVARAAVPGGPGRLSTTGSVVLVSRDDEVLAFARRPALRPPRPLPATPAELVARLGSVDWRERARARESLATPGGAEREALRAARDGKGSAELRESARELVEVAEARAAWAEGFPHLRPLELDALLARRPIDRLRAMTSLAVPQGSGEVARARVAFRRAAAHDSDGSLRIEALGQLARFDDQARSALLAVIEAKPTDGSDVELERAREAAAAAYVAAGVARAKPATELEQLLARSPDNVRAALYRALLRRHNGLSYEGTIVSTHANAGRREPDPNNKGKLRDVGPDEVAQRELTSWNRRHDNDDPETLEDQSVESAQRKVALDDERRALFARPELEPVLRERAP